ncbi:MAG: KdsC family phosphatase [Flavobacteriaceae bacterium]|nr:3-deoxy-D-manno-octulosonate 8-phosphate phosphatase [Flavobacteriales bacterium]RCL69128.1 MAG: 3-deoxy-D-manno-octulosonate 8-phosphate phosphatase [Bacteroidota bacterium]|tara:strand:- start:2819 stop:3322 length:504 start_codon:yes stop_codon:yes gene_type:complete
METNYKENLKNIKAFVFDVDGVLTDGKLLISETGELLRSMNVKDGFAMKFAIDNGFKIGIISGGTNEAVRKRLSDLGIEEIHLKSHNKIVPFNDFKDKYGLQAENILVMGDDIPDIPIIKAAGIGCCPQDAVQEVKNSSDYISQKSGGMGAVRDIIEQVMKIHKKWI